MGGMPVARPLVGTSLKDSAFKTINVTITVLAKRSLSVSATEALRRTTLSIIYTGELS